MVTIACEFGTCFLIGACTLPQYIMFQVMAPEATVQALGEVVSEAVALEAEAEAAVSEVVLSEPVSVI